LLTRPFFERDPIVVSRELLGKILIRRYGDVLLAGRIVETEAYLGIGDPAAHAFAGLTDRNQVLFGPAGHAYVYFIYGVHYCLNFSCMPEGEAGCTLIRALEPIAGIEHMQSARLLGKHALTPRLQKQLCSGPGKLCQAFHIHRAHDNGKDICAPKSDLQVHDDGFQLLPQDIATTPRIGITKAAELPLRFVVRDSPYLSKTVRS
jgi:DNA-3-methyladenine glycosylase